MALLGIKVQFPKHQCNQLTLGVAKVTIYVEIFVACIFHG